MSTASITYTVAFFAGVSTFFASCLLPLVPLYLMYLTGLSLTNLTKKSRLHVLKMSVLFACGFMCTFVLMGVGVGILGRFLAPYSQIIGRIVGVVFILLGLSILNILPTSFLHEKRFDSAPFLEKSGVFSALIMGVSFAFAWTPCVGPVLSVILFWSSQQETFVAGTLLLVIYGLGIGVPFIITGLFFERLAPFLKRAGLFSQIMQYVSAFVIITVGITMLFGNFQSFTIHLLQRVGL